MTEHERPTWTIPAPSYGWYAPWPRCFELARELHSDAWTLVGGLMVQLHLLQAGINIIRPTEDVDVVAHIESDRSRVTAVRSALLRLQYHHQPPMTAGTAAHRFVRGDSEIIDLMIADHAGSDPEPTIGGHPVMRMPGATGALRRTVNCQIDTGGGTATVSLPNPLGALVLKSAAYIEDSRDRRRHLDDLVGLAATIIDPHEWVPQMRGHDRGRLRKVWKILEDRDHPSWSRLPPDRLPTARETFNVLTQNPQDLVLVTPLGR